MAEDWFAQNAPKGQSAPAGGDWFTQHAPSPNGPPSPHDPTLKERFMSATEPTLPNPNTKPKDSSFKANIDAAWNAGTNALNVGGNVVKRAARIAEGTFELPGHIESITNRLFSSDEKESSEAEGELLAMHPGAQIADRLKEAVHDWRKSKSLAAENIVGDLLGVYLTGKAGEIAGKTGKAVAKLPVKAGEAMVRNATETTPRDVANVVKEASAKNEVATQKASDQTAEHVRQVEEKNRSAREAAEKKNAENDQEHLQKTQEALHKTRGSEVQTEFENKQAAEKAKQDHASAVAEVEARNTEALAKAAREHAEKVQTVEASNAVKQAEYDAAKAKRSEVQEAAKDQLTKRGKLARQVNQRSARMVERLKTIKAQWKDSGALQRQPGYKPTGKLDVMYDKVRKATQGASVSRSTLADAVLDVEDQHIKGSDENIKVFRDILTKAIEDDAPEFINKGGKVKSGHSLAEVVGKVDREGMERHNQ